MNRREFIGYYPPGGFGFRRELRQICWLINHWNIGQSIAPGRQAYFNWRREYSRRRYNAKHPEIPVPEPYKPPTNDDDLNAEMMALFLLAEQNGMGNQLSNLCEVMRKIGRDEALWKAA